VAHTSASHHHPGRSHRRQLRWCSIGLLASLASVAAAQDAQRGAGLYLRLPAAASSCVDCHGPDPLADRNRLLNAAAGPAAIGLAINRAVPMGFLRDILSEADRLDLSAYLAQVAALSGAELVIWPRVLEFGRVGVGSVMQSQAVWVHNAGATSLPVAVALAGEGFEFQHDCPPELAPGQTCRAQVGLRTGELRRLGAVLHWDWGNGRSLPVGVTGHVDAEPSGAAESGRSLLRLQGLSGQTVSESFSIVNAGTSGMTLGASALTGPGSAAFSLTGSGCASGLYLLPGQACTVRVNAVPGGSSPQRAMLQWRSDGAHLPPIQLEAESTGLPPVASPPPAPPPAPTPPTAPVPAPTPPPTPMPTPSPAQGSGGGGGGCAVALSPGDRDPLLPVLLFASALLMWRRELAASARRVAACVSPGRAV